MPIAAVWGASGFIGRHLVAALLENGWQVRALVRDPAGLRESQCTDIRQVDFDSSSETMRAALEGVTLAYHCAGAPAANDKGLRSYVGASGRFAEAAEHAGVGRLIHISTVAVYGARGCQLVGASSDALGDTPYALSRLAAERAVIDVGKSGYLHVAVVRIPMVVGPGMASKALHRLFRSFPGGVFFHPGDKRSMLNCIGISRLSIILAALGECDWGGKNIFQFADSVRWLDIVKEFSRVSNRIIWRIRIPMLLAQALSFVATGNANREKLSVLANRVYFEHDPLPFIAQSMRLPETMEDITALVSDENMARRAVGP